MSKERRYYKDSRGRQRWEYVYRVTRGPLKGRTYKSESTYRRALDKVYDRDIVREERYGELFQLFILQKGGRYAKQHRKRFNELYRKSAAGGFDTCPPANDVENIERDAPYAALLDFIGTRPIDEFGWVCIGDTREARKSK